VGVLGRHIMACAAEGADPMALIVDALDAAVQLVAAGTESRVEVVFVLSVCGAAVGVPASVVEPLVLDALARTEEAS
jgi:hypothetical protein